MFKSDVRQEQADGSDPQYSTIRRVGAKLLDKIQGLLFVPLKGRTFEGDQPEAQRLPIRGALARGSYRIWSQRTKRIQITSCGRKTRKRRH